MTPRRPVRGHTEAGTIVFTEFVLDGASWHLTLREGATAVETLALLAECSKVQVALTEAGAAFILTRDAREMLQRRQARQVASPSAAPGNGNGNGHSKPAVVKTAAWLQAGKDLAQRCPHYVSTSGHPNYRYMTEVAGENGFSQIDDTNIAEVLTALEGAAAQA
jgi:hypothetical protein